MADLFYDSVLRPCLDQLSNVEGPDYGNLRNRTSSPLDLADLQGDLREFSDDDIPSQLPGTPGLLDDSDLASDDAKYADAAGQAGLDIYAFYKSFRFLNSHPFPRKWGIFVISNGVAALARQLSRDAFASAHGAPTPGEAYNLAFDVLVRHEEYHFWIDVWALQQEVLPLKDRVKRYERYFVEKSAPSLFDDDIEESLANHHAYESLRDRRFGVGRSAGPALRDVLSLGPGPYADFNLSTARRREFESQLAVAVGGGRAVPPAVAEYALVHGCHPSDLVGATLRPPRRDNTLVGARNCPRYVLAAPGYSRLLIPFQAPSLHEAQTFVTRYLAGELERHTDHSYFRIDNGQRVKFPNPHEKDLKPWEFKNILAKAGMNSAEYRHQRELTKIWSKQCPRSPVKPARLG